MRISPDETVLFHRGWITVNMTLAATWTVMALLALVSWSATRGYGRRTPPPRRRLVLETAVEIILGQIKDLGFAAPRKYLPFLGALFLFIAAANFLSIVPGYEPPTASLSTTGALAVCVFLAVPAFGIAERGRGGISRASSGPIPSCCRST